MSSEENALIDATLMQELFASGLYKRNQGKMVRQITAIAIFLVAGCFGLARSCVVHRARQLATAIGWSVI